MKKSITIICFILFVFYLTSVLCADSGVDVELKKINQQFYMLENHLQKIKLADTTVRIISLSKKITELSDQLNLMMYELEKKNPELFNSRKPQKKIIAIMDRFQSLVPKMKMIIVKLLSFKEYMDVKTAIKSLNKLFE